MGDAPDCTILNRSALTARPITPQPAALAKRFPQIVWDGVELGLYEADRGVLMARRAVQTLVQEFVAAGGEYRQAAIVPRKADASFDSIRTVDGHR